MFNSDGDSSISFEEYVGGVQVLDEAMRQEDLQLTFEGLDADGNGELYKYEFTNIIREHCRDHPVGLYNCVCGTTKGFCYQM
jgi:Ca2+-binding EF-hand superfamily protein